MAFILNCIQFIAHLDIHLQTLVLNYGTWVYLILFIIIFIETGLIVTPFLPGDSLLFAAGSLAALGNLNPHLLVSLLLIAAVLGDNLNYFIGRFVGLRLFQRPDSRFFKRIHLEKAHQFYEKHGPKAIIIARFIPVVRTFMPFTAGLSKMTYQRFFTFDILGGALWVGGIVYISYLFGNIPVIKNNFSIMVFAIIGISLLPILWELTMNRFNKR